MAFDPKEQLAHGTLAALMAVQRENGNQWPIFDEARVLRDATLTMLEGPRNKIPQVIATLMGEPKRKFLIEVSVVEIDSEAKTEVKRFRLNAEPRLWTLKDVEEAPWAQNDPTLHVLLSRLHGLPVGGAFEFTLGTFRRLS